MDVESASAAYFGITVAPHEYFDQTGMSGRVDAFALLKEPASFPTKAKATQPPVEEAAIEDIARQNNFPSRPANKQPKPERRKQLRYRTGRNQHLGIRATAETVERFLQSCGRATCTAWRITASCA
jgi:hypothetical protein